MLRIPINVSRAINIEKPLAEVHAALCQFKTWPNWSPWQCLDRQAQVSYFGEEGALNSGFHWTGQWIGEGEIQHQTISAEQIDMRIEFFKPWQSVGQVGFKLSATTEHSTDVSWYMHGSLPLWLFFLKSTMQAYMAMDYDRGLLMLKDYLETGEVASASEVLGVVEMPETYYLGIRQECTIDDISSSMHDTCNTLETRFAETGLTLTGAPFSLVYDWNLKTRHCDYCFAYPIAKPDRDDYPGLILATRPAMKTLKIRHTGAYKFLGNAWATGFARINNDKSLKLNKKLPSFEVYVSNPNETDSGALLTEVYLSLR